MKSEFKNYTQVLLRYSQLLARELYYPQLSVRDKIYTTAVNKYYNFIIEAMTQNTAQIPGSWTLSKLLVPGLPSFVWLFSGGSDTPESACPWDSPSLLPASSRWFPPTCYLFWKPGWVRIKGSPHVGNLPFTPGLSLPGCLWPKSGSEDATTWGEGLMYRWASQLPQSLASGWAIPSSGVIKEIDTMNISRGCLQERNPNTILSPNPVEIAGFLWAGQRVVWGEEGFVFLIFGFSCIWSCCLNFHTNP